MSRPPEHSRRHVDRMRERTDKWTLRWSGTDTRGREGGSVNRCRGVGGSSLDGGLNPRAVRTFAPAPPAHLHFPTRVPPLCNAARATLRASAHEIGPRRLTGAYGPGPDPTVPQLFDAARAGASGLARNTSRSHESRSMRPGVRRPIATVGTESDCSSRIATARRRCLAAGQDCCRSRTQEARRRGRRPVQRGETCGSLAGRRGADTSGLS